MLVNLIFGLFLIALAGAMLLVHRRAARRAAERDDLDDDEFAFTRKQHRRRVGVCVILAVVGTAIICGALVTHPLLAAGYWSCVVLLVFWMAWLALADLMGSQTQLRRLRDEHQAEHDKLRAELAKYLPAQPTVSTPTKGSE